ncbi:MAG: choice-of-anchor B family protein [Bacteroidetes bacterium]|nr:choice-of-anchor B family protein [Bacteroidota bacterium]
MRSYSLLFWMTVFTCSAAAQLNMTQLGYLDIPTNHATQLNGIWGYTDEAGNEYALVGTKDGVSIVDITVPSNPAEILFIAGQNSIWREIKTNGDYAYVTTEAEEGLLIIDLSPLPASTALPVSYYTGPVGNEWNTAHSLYAANGYVYINGSGRGNGGLIILDVATDPMNPVEVGDFDTWYVHDCYVRDDTAYLAHIYDGFFSILDITDKANPILLGSAITPTSFSHNVWTSTDGNYAFTTDEVSGGFIGAFDVSDPSNIVYLDKIQSSPGSGIVPHNAHVNGNYLVTSYYADGVVVHDITYPYNLVEVGNHDTNPHENPTTSGCWGVYPYFPSGNIIASDREEGLYVFGVSYQPGAYLEGTITEMGTGNPINNVTVTIDGQDITDYSGVPGNYATGIAAGGTYDVSYFKVLYYPQTISTVLTNGVVQVQDVVLEKIPQFNLTIEVLDAATFDPVENAQVKLQHTYIAHEGVTDANGLVTLGLYYQDNYDLYAGKWGFESACYIDTLITNTSATVTIYVNQGYYDDFTFDFDWLSAGDADRGWWEREIPVGVTGTSGAVQNPYADISWECGNFAYLTGNGTMVSNAEEVNGGEAVLISPVFDLTGYSDPHLNFSSWFYNQFGYSPVNDTLKFYLFDGTSTVLIDKKFDANTYMSQWVPNSIRISDFTVPNSTMQLIVSLSDELATENITEGGIDYFSITDFSLLSVNTESENTLTIFPNPAQNSFTIKGVSEGRVELCDLTGRVISEQPVREEQCCTNFSPGIYLVRIFDPSDKLLSIQKLVIE